MSEKEKMLTGKIYQAWDKELVAERTKAKSLCYQFNHLSPNSPQEKATLIIKELLGSVPGDIKIEAPFYCDYGSNIHVGENFYANVNCVILDEAKITIGDNVLLGPNVNIFAACHPLNHQERSTGVEFSKPITIGDDVWIGGNVTILPGVTIGNRSIIGAGSVVSKDIPDDVIAAGNPCKVIRKND